MKIVAVSDTHNRHKRLEIPEGDILIHAGDATSLGYKHEIESLGAWLKRLPHKVKIFVPGNHDFMFEQDPMQARELAGDGKNGVHVLIDESLEVDGIRIYGSPWSKEFGAWAFMASEEMLRAFYSKVPEGLDILVTHGPAYGLLDKLARNGEAAGSKSLRVALSDKRPRFHICGHIHEAYGTARFGDTRIFNASTCNLSYNAVNAPHVFEV